ncbi:hypothetical protein COCMIDRAFT_8852, partial [Bipolaris oryzae ATCC 44560]
MKTMKRLLFVFFVLLLVSGVKAPLQKGYVVVREDIAQEAVTAIKMMVEEMAKIESNVRPVLPSWVMAAMLLSPLWLPVGIWLAARAVVLWDKTIRDALADPDRHGWFLRAILLVDRNLLWQSTREDGALAAAQVDAAAARAETAAARAETAAA